MEFADWFSRQAIYQSAKQDCEASWNAGEENIVSINESQAAAEGYEEGKAEGYRAGLLKAAEIARSEAERIKHTSHSDGLGMGDQSAESACLEVAAAIEREAEKEQP